MDIIFPIIETTTHLLPQIINFIIKPYLEPDFLREPYFYGPDRMSDFDIGKYDLTFYLDLPIHIDYGSCCLGCCINDSIGTFEFLVCKKKINDYWIDNCSMGSSLLRDNCLDNK